MVHQKFHGSLPPQAAASGRSRHLWPYPRYIAHRGGGRHAPENTLAGVRTAALHGYAMVEVDVKFSLDEVPILLHDDDIARTSNGTGTAASLSLRELSFHDFGAWHSRRFAGEPLPTLATIAAFTKAHGLAINIELKPSPGLEGRTGTIVGRAAAELWHRAARGPLLSSFSEEALAAARKSAPALPRALLFEGRPPADWQDRLAALDCIALHVHHEQVDRIRIDAAHAAGYAIAAWTVNDPGRARQLLSWGCDAIFTDELDRIAPFE